jgi:cellobiose-specific phosphotransferase system component IIB
MCPECISNIALVAVAGVTSTGGLTAFVMQKFTWKHGNASNVESFEQQELNRNHKENHDADDN